MEYFDIISTVIKRRRSIRNFNNRPVDMDLVKKIIDIASHAPSNNNRQGWKFYVTKESAIKQAFCDLILKKLKDRKHQAEQKSKIIDTLMTEYEKHFMHFKNAPVIVVCCFVKPNRFQTEIFETDQENQHMTGELISLSLVIQNMLLLADSLGLGTLVMTSPLVIAQDIKKILEIPEKYAIGSFVCMGHYDKRPDPPRHYELDRILHIK